MTSVNKGQAEFQGRTRLDLMPISAISPTR